MHITLIIIFSILILLAGASFLLMIFPAHLFLLLISLAFGLIDHFQHLRLWEWGILAGLVVIMVFVDWTSGLWGAKISGANRKSVLWGLIGLVIGLFAFPPFGSIIGLFLGVLVAELSDYQHLKKAVKAAAGSVLGSLAGTLINLILAVVFLVIFIIFSLH